MTPFFRDEWLTVYGGDCRAVLREMEPESVNCVVTSPPYWGLRDYGTPGQLGLEPTPEAYVAAMVEVFREVRRVLRADGTLWLNLGDSYASAPPGNGKGFTPETTGLHGGRNSARYQATMDAGHGTKRNTVVAGLKPKDLVGIPWRVAFALQADGWYLRSDIIWSKPNPMPESVTDRPTKSHEYLFLLSKSARYFFDADAVKEQPTGDGSDGRRGNGSASANSRISGGLAIGSATHMGVPAMGRNLRSVWTIATAPYPGAHFATFPPKLVEPCVNAGCPDRTCSACGAPWERVVERGNSEHHHRAGCGHVALDSGDLYDGGRYGGFANTARDTGGWRPTCAHDAPTVPGVVLDPFAGTGTVGLVAQRLSRRAVLIDLNPDYLRQCLARNSQTPLGLPA